MHIKFEVVFTWALEVSTRFDKQNKNNKLKKRGKKGGGGRGITSSNLSRGSTISFFIAPPSL